MSGEFVDLDNRSADILLELSRKVLTNRSYVERAHYFKEVIAKTRGLDIAADVIEQASRKGADGEPLPTYEQQRPFAGEKNDSIIIECI